VILRIKEASMQRRKAFTLLELLIVIGIILLLISILLPVLSGVRAQGHAVLCQNNERSLWQGITAFAADNDGHLVGNVKDTGDPILSHRDWLRGDGSASWMGAPQAGTLWKYIHNTAPYLCPTREIRPGIGTFNAKSDLDLSSNGQFDYAIFLSFAGAKLEHMPAQATATDPSSGATTVIPTPYLVEAQSKFINKTNMTGGHETTDHIAHNHFGGSYYISPDGACQFYIEPMTMTATDYSAKTIRSSAVSLGQKWAWGTWDGK
jgi:prepilin-type N-terminal cleavage/methylation domain-containing protein